VENTGLITREQMLANRERMVGMGIWERKDTGSGYHMKVQPMMRLLAGGVYQNRQILNTIMDRLDRLEAVR